MQQMTGALWFLTRHHWALVNQVVALSLRPEMGDPRQDTGTQSWVSVLECTLRLQRLNRDDPKNVQHAVQEPGDCRNERFWLSHKNQQYGASESCSAATAKKIMPTRWALKSLHSLAVMQTNLSHLKPRQSNVQQISGLSCVGTLHGVSGHVSTQVS